tara:strand:- start:92 stop:364 length:273 start_codon:yes stop_codon:yes gene_type:complete
MPKAKPTQVIVHRIEFQEKERDLLESYAISKTINNIAWPVVAAGTAIGSFYLAIEIYGQSTAAWDWAKDTNFGKAVKAGLTTDFVKFFTG